METLNLFTCAANKNYKIKAVKLAEAKRRKLEKLGIVSGEEVFVVQKNYAKTSVLVRVSGISYAIDRSFAMEMEVYE